MKHRYQLLALLILAIALCGCESPKDVVVGVEAPLNVKNGDEFIIITTVKNTASIQQTLVSLDIADAYLDGIAIVRTEPDHKESTHIPLDNTMSYVFNLPVEASKHIEIKLHAKAVKQGDYNSEIDFCINSGFSFLSKAIRTIVE